jgi:hypothetical protein
MISLAALLTSSALPVFSQERKPAPEWTQKVPAPDAPLPKEPSGDVMVFRREKLQDPGVGHPADDVFFFVNSEMSFDGKVVKGAPYSAEAVTESTQILGDGNRIVNKSSAAIYRDSEGRTRREQTLRALGPFANGGDPPQTIAISDPVAGVSYMLDARSKVARKTSPMRFTFKLKEPADVSKGATSDDEKPAPEAGKIETVMVAKEARAPEVSGVLSAKIHGEAGMMKAPMGEGAGFVMEFHGADKKNAKKESLGEQLFDGVKAEGTRTTITIPAGEIGNERPIEMIMERWYSPELQTVVMTRHSDPRFGETVYKLININRNEPARSLFEVPADYTVKEPAAPGAPVHVRTRKPPIEE